MTEHGPLPFAAWEGFYVIMGTSAAALTGLQFVVIVLLAEGRARSSMQEVVAAFSTPTIVHFGTVLLISGILSAPWHSLSSASVLLVPCGIAGMIYAAIVARRARQQTGYKPVLEDWIWHAALPFLAHATIVGASIALWNSRGGALFVVGAATLLLLFVGIHNAWDALTYVAIEWMQPPNEPTDQK